MLLKVTVRHAENLRCMNRRGPFHSFATVWVHNNNKLSTNVDEKRDRCPIWNKTLSIPLSGPIDDNITLTIAIFDARKDGNQKLIGSAKLKLKEVEMEVGLGKRAGRTLKLKRYLCWSRGHVVVEVLIGEAGTWSKTKKFVKAVARVLTVAAEVSQIVEACEG